MAKSKIGDFSTTPANNTDIDNIDIAEIIPDPIFPYNGCKNKQLVINLVNTNLVKTEEEALNSALETREVTYDDFTE